MGGTYGVFRFSSLPGHGGSHVDVHGVGGRSQRKCTRKHPPGRKVYQRGAHAIWEVDGAKEKVRTYRSPESSNFFSYAKRAVILPESVTIWKIVHRHQDPFLRLR